MPNKYSLQWLRISEENVLDKSIKNTHLKEQILPINIDGVEYSYGNKFDSSSKHILENMFLMATTGAEIVNDNYSISHFIEVLPGEKYTTSVSPQQVCCFYDSNKSFICGIEDLNINGSTSYTINVPGNSRIRYMRVNLKTSICILKDYMIIYGSDLPISYLPFNKSKYSISWVDDIIYSLKGNDDLQVLLNSGLRTIELDPSITYNMSNINIPSGTTIIGNNAKIVSNSVEFPVFNIGDINSTGTVDVTLKSIRFFGSSRIVDNMPSIPTDCGIYMNKSARIRISECRFENFLGCGVNCFDFPTDPPVDYHMQQNIITNNIFHYCFMGVAIWNRAEYGICSDNIFSYCRVGIWSQSGNWLFTGNSIYESRAGFVSTLDLNNMVSVAGINPQHGSFVGNTINHCRSDQPITWKNANYLIDDIDYQGVWIDGKNTCFPPTFGTNTMYYTDLKYMNSAQSGIPYWYITGCVLSQMTVSCDLTGKMGILGCTEQANVKKVNVKNLLVGS